MRKFMRLVSGVAFGRGGTAAGPAVGVGTVRTVGGERQVFVEVVAVSGETFIGKLSRSEGDPDVSTLRPGLVLLVAFDPAAPEELSLPRDEEAVLAAGAIAPHPPRN